MHIPCARSFVVLCSLCFACACARPVAPQATVTNHASTQQQRRPTPPELGQWIDTYVSAFGQNWGPAYAFTGFIGVARDGQWIYTRGFGKADYEKGVAADADTRFRIGSLTKQFTAVAVMQLVERGALRTSDAIGSYVPGLSHEIAHVTLHQLLAQASGIASYTDDPQLMAQDRQPHAVSEVLASFAHTPLHFSPGERFEYSNSNYFLLGLAIEKASGLRYEDYLQKFVLGPAGLRRTSTIDAPDAADSAIGYVANETDDGLVPDGPFDMSMPFSAGALRSTANDLLAWDRAWTNHTLLTAASQTRMITVDAKLQREGGKGYGYGLGISQRAGRQMIAHGGAIRGFTSYLGRIPQEGLVVIALCNAMTFNASLVADPIMDMFINEAPLAPPVEIPASVLGKELATSLAGKYVLQAESRAEMSAQLSASALDALAVMEFQPTTNKLFLVSGGNRVEVFRGPGGELFCKRDHVKLTIEPDTAAPTQVLLQQGPVRLRYDRAKSRDSPQP